ncbi:ATPase PAAT [Thalassophryne amazonica]|uniref:ATPase PAAT n=1 Tax=Thalassophryne amazonica TaxID=390379 RepID=UPI001470EB7E|nr:ATPase PAAT [Thalassophryne amazonica]XP_034049554.1 ATPase PAAT [Thalassophryne amazonica]
MVDIAVQYGAAWVCQSQGCHLADVLLPVHASNKDDDKELAWTDGDATNCWVPVLLEQTEEGSPCVLTVCCSSTPSDSTPSAISRLLVVSEARTMEVYDQTGNYCGTVRGVRDDSIQMESTDRGPFYRKQLILEHPSTSCDLKLLSLAGRSSVVVGRVVVGLQTLQPRPVCGASINMQQVQSLVDEMGTSLSPGAQNLMDMVHFQQKNQTGSLGNFLPLLVGGGPFCARTQGVGVSPSDIQNDVHAADSRLGSGTPTNGAQPAQTGVTPDGSNHTASCKSGDPMSHAHLVEMISHLLKGQGRDQALCPSPEILPMLQSVCGQVTKLRIDDAATANGTWELDAAMERHLDEMERRLKEHIDRRLDALEQHLEKALLRVLLASPHQETTSSLAVRVAPKEPAEQIQMGPAETLNSSEPRTD